MLLMCPVCASGTSSGGQTAIHYSYSRTLRKGISQAPILQFRGVGIRGHPTRNYNTVRQTKNSGK